MMSPFKFTRATSVEDASKSFGSAADARYLAGGQTLLPVIKQRLAAPDAVISLSKVAELAGITVKSGEIVIGAMTRHADVSESVDVHRAIPALAHLAGGIGDPHVRNRGTIGGSLANSDPAADYPAGVLGLGATLHTDRRAIPADGFFQGMFATSLEPGELITRISFPIPERAGYVKIPNPASRYAVVGVMVSAAKGRVRVAVTGAGPCAFRVPDMEIALQRSFSPDAIAGIKIAADDLNSDIHASADYRAHLVTVSAKRAVVAALSGQ